MRIYRLQSGKNNKFLYYLRAYCRQLIPPLLCRWWGKLLLRSIDTHPQHELIKKRIDYYCPLQEAVKLPAEAPCLGDMRIPKKQKVYFFDSQEVTHFFPKKKHWLLEAGDVNYPLQYPAICKSRPLSPDNTNNILLKLDKVRHFIFVTDKKKWKDKIPAAIFRGKVAGKAERMQFMKLYFGSAVCNCGDVSRSSLVPAEWQTPKLTIQEHLQYRYILALEGNDVASNLKWVMSSNSIAVMPKPTCETWFMEGTLIPNYHYIEIKPDFSDLSDRMAYYNTHPEEASAIIHHAHEYVHQFQNRKVEQLVAIGVMDKYLRLTNS